MKDLYWITVMILILFMLGVISKNIIIAMQALGMEPILPIDMILR